MASKPSARHKSSATPAAKSATARAKTSASKEGATKSAKAKKPAAKSGAATAKAAAKAAPKPGGRGTAPKPAAKTVANKTATKKAAAKKPAAKKKPAVEKPAAKKPAAKKPAVKKIVAKKPAVKKPAAKKAAAKKPAVKKPAKAAKPATPVRAKKAPAAKKPVKPPIQFKPAPSRFLEPLSTPKKRHGPAVSPATIERLKTMLIEERERLVGQADKLFAEAESLVKDRELGDTQFDEESGEGDTISIERERDLAVSAQHRQKIELVDAAFTRIAGGTYGYCLVCGDRIPVARLEAAPEAEMCVKCKQRGERRR